MRIRKTPKNTPARVVSRLLDKNPQATPANVVEALADFDLHPAVLQEWMNEPANRAATMAKSARRWFKKKASNFGRRGDSFRRILFTLPVKDGQQREYHATKGWRSYRAVT